MRLSAVILNIVIMFVSTMAAAQQVQEYDFHVFMNETRIGDHRVTVQHDDRTTYVDIEIELEVKLGPFTLYDYSHKNRAVWQDNILQSFQSETDDDGDLWTVKTDRRETGDFFLSLNKADPEPYDIWFPTTYWNKETVQQKNLLSTQDGQIFFVETNRVGTETLMIQGQETITEKFEMRGEVNIDLWYDETGRWVKMSFQRDGNDFLYVLQ